jgi:hypothetical protein
MGAIDELINSTEKLCLNLENASKNEAQFLDVIQSELEKMCWQAQRMKSNLEQIKEYQMGSF